MLVPIRGYCDGPLLDLNAAVQPLIPIMPHIEEMVYFALEIAKTKPPSALSIDQKASIILYTMGWQGNSSPLYSILNTTLRGADRKKLKPWFPYLHLIMSALVQLPQSTRTIFSRYQG
ncbi:MAG: hypothetical protein HC938_15720 [Nitrospira sp.]|nr:hypothetical protein [Nitrospira sp.]